MVFDYSTSQNTNQLSCKTRDEQILYSYTKDYTKIIPMFSDRLNIIKSKLAEIRKYQVTCFGSGTHQFLLNPTISEQEILSFEKKHQIELPVEYRAFLLQVGNGGAGPAYGLLPLEKWAKGQKEYARLAEEEKLPKDYLSVPCPLYPELRKQPESTWKQMHTQQKEKCYQGMITLSDEGCTYYALLIICGPYRGRVVHIDLDGQAPYFDKNLDFLSWYEAWIEEVLEEANFGFPLSMGKDEFLTILQDQNQQKKWPSAIKALSHTGKPNKSTLKIILALLDNKYSLIRIEVVKALGMWKLTACANKLREMVFDELEEKQVRIKAFKVLCDLPKVDWQIDARRLLQDPNPELVEDALYALYYESVLEEAELKPFLASPHSKLKKAAKEIHRFILTRKREAKKKKAKHIM